MTTSDHPWSDQQSSKLLSEYHKRHPVFQRVLEHVMAALRDFKLATDMDHQVHSVKGRIKAFESLREKAWRANQSLDANEVFSSTDDIVAARIICNNLEARDLACGWVRQLAHERKALKILQDAPKTYRTGYRSHHFLVSLEPRHWPGIHSYTGSLADVKVEIQVRTILEEAWGEIEHPLVYKTAFQVPDFLRGRFQALSANLHNADLSVQRLVTDIGKRTATSIYVPSYEIDPRQLGVDDSLVPSIEKALTDLALLRQKREYEESAAVIRALMENVRIAAAMESVGALADLHCEIALSYLMWARQEGRAGVTPKSEECLRLAEKEYARAESSAGGERLPFVPWRRAEIANLREDFAGAADLARLALELLDAHGIPKYYRKKIHRGTFLRSVGVYCSNRWRYEQASESAQKEALEQALSANAESISAIRRDLTKMTAPGRAELERDFLRSVNNQVYLFLLRGDPESLEKAVELIKEVSDVVSDIVSSKDLEFLDTQLTARLANMVGRPDLKVFEELDRTRSRILELLCAPDCNLRKQDVEEVLGHVGDFDQRWANAVRALYRTEAADGNILR